MTECRNNTKKCWEFLATAQSWEMKDDLVTRCYTSQPVPRHGSVANTDVEAQIDQTPIKVMWEEQCDEAHQRKADKYSV